MTDPRPFDAKKELFRKSIHIGAILVPLIAMLSDVLMAASLVISLTILYLVSEYMRLRGGRLSYVTSITELATRHGTEPQHKLIMSPLYLAAGTLVSLLVFPEPINYVSILVLALGDGFASLAGKKYGIHKIPGTGKTMEGSLTGVACAFAGVMLLVSPQLALAAAIVGMTIELVPLPINDNISVPLGTGTATWILLSYTNVFL